MSEDNEIIIDGVRELEKKGTTGRSYPDDPENTATALKEFRYVSGPVSETEAKRQMSIRSRRGFLVGGIAGLLGVFGWRWMPDETKNDLLRRTFEFNERVSQAFYSPKRLAPEFPPSRITAARVNGALGLETEITVSDWQLSVTGLPGGSALSIDQIKAMPRTEMITELKCIEGWSTIVHWSGVRFSDFVVACGGMPDKLPKYVSMKTPDEKYYVGWDIEAILHPQTLLAYEMNGASLTNEHGAPLRLASPTKYGIKQIKRIGRIEFTNERPRDFWAESGYDWYAGL
ncbi:MAG: molybdopterin-dependent oxidoreductase [Pyrinomonadaceae bacterium]